MFEDLFKYNYPVMFRRDRGAVSVRLYMPRKGYLTEETLLGDLAEDAGISVDVPDDEVLAALCNRTINKFRDAIALIEQFRDGEIDEVYYWDMPEGG